MNRLFYASLLIIAAAAQIAAAQLVDNGAPNPDAGAVASNFAGHDPEYEFQSADDFRLATASTLTQVRWWGLYQGSNIPLEPDVFTIRIFADNAGVPASTPLVELQIERVHRRVTELVSAGYDVYEYTALLKPHISLPAGTYWLSIVNDVDTEEVGTDWLWALNNNDAGNFAARVSDSSAWQSPHSFALAFQIKGSAHAKKK